MRLTSTIFFLLAGGGFWACVTGLVHLAEGRPAKDDFFWVTLLLVGVIVGGVRELVWRRKRGTDSDGDSD